MWCMGVIKWHVRFPSRWRAKLMINCYTLFTLLLLYFSVIKLNLTACFRYLPFATWNLRFTQHTVIRCCKHRMLRSMQLSAWVAYAAAAAASLPPTGSNHVTLLTYWRSSASALSRAIFKRNLYRVFSEIAGTERRIYIFRGVKWTPFSVLCIRYNTAWSGICERNEHKPLKTVL